MDFVVLGCGSAFPSPKRGASSYVVRLPNGECWMFDCGEGTQIELMKSEIRAGRIRRIFITHMHGDHVFGLPGLMCTMGQLGSASAESDMENELPSVDIYGPRGLRRYVREVLRLSRSVLPYRYRVHELQFDDRDFQTTTPFTGDHDQLMAVRWDSGAETESCPLHPNEESGSDIHPSTAGLWDLSLPPSSPASVSAAWLPHTIPSFAFLLREPDRPGKLDVVKAKELGVPNGPLLGRLKAGHDVTTPHGKTVAAAEVVGPALPGRLVAILGDTSDSEPAVRALVGEEGRLDLLVHEATLGEEMHESAAMKGHSTPVQAARSAKVGRAECLLLTHFSQRYDDDEIEALKEEAAREFKGRIELARPLMKIRI